MTNAIYRMLRKLFKKNEPKEELKAERVFRISKTNLHLEAIVPQEKRAQAIQIFDCDYLNSATSNCTTTNYHGVCNCQDKSLCSKMALERAYELEPIQQS